MSVKRLFFVYYIAIIIVSMTIFTYVTLFLYKNFYQTITQSEELIMLRREVVSDDININKYNKIISKIEQKKLKRSIKYVPNF